MKQKVILIILCSLLIATPLVIGVSPGDIVEDSFIGDYRQVTVYAPAVANTESGYIGVISTITVTIQSNGTGRVFVDTLPLTQIDMQGSARLAVKVANALLESDDTCDVNTTDYDYFFVVRTKAPIIGGPSAGAIMTVATVSLLQNWDISNATVMTGMINPDGSIGPVGGIPQKIDAAYSVGATRFLVPKGQGTYQETITETVQENGWTRIVTRTVTRNVSDYAMDNYNMDVVEVEDVNDALEYMTGYELPTPVSNGNISTENYTRSMKPLAGILLDQAQEMYDNASQAFENASIPNRFPTYYEDEISDFLELAHHRLSDAENWYDQQVYYTSTSKSFQSLINSQYVLFTSEFFETDSGQEYVSELLAQAESLFTNKSNQAKNTPIQGMLSLQGVGAAQERITEAATYLEDAKTSYQSNDYLTALYRIAFTIQRSESVSWWLDIVTHFNDSGSINNSELTDLAEEYMSDAQQSLTYSEVILQQIGSSSSYLSDAQTLLDAAQNNLDDGYPAAALFEGLEALVKANLALELVDGNDATKRQRAQESASASITESRQRGVEPVLAVSYYEYAQSLENESNYDDAIVYYKYSDFIAGILGLRASCPVDSSRYVGIPEVEQPSIFANLMKYGVFIILFVLFGGIAGFTLGLLAADKTSSRKKDTQTPWTPRSIDDYYRKNK